ncbi:hypothetical protein A1507_14510 [Methylomonas koyamae]|uniref:Glycosyltransferase 2-like domain-containing protein n=1 Tax=Methylomonas koyamae TaxID=702114 RepID=A0A177NBV9_9GAMM|nr:glycosyltransferase family 2 protein [Methylomonas koyamae]OAI15114.1 hypothetical protein A1507_14510 [Methylomonas koyamae]
MGEQLPKISVIIPTFNQGNFIEKTIESVISQDYPNFELIIIDGGSTDNTIDIIRQYEQYLTYWVSEPDRGQSHAINKGMAIATGDILTWLNSDDWYLPGTLYKFSEIFQENPDAGIVVGCGRIIDLSGNEVHAIKPNPDIDLESLFNWMNGGDFLQPSSAFSRLAWELAGPIDESIHIALDVDLWLRMAKNGVKFVSTEGFLAEALSHPNAKTTAFENLMIIDCAMVITQHGGKKHVEKILSQLANKLSWYEKNYQAIIQNPIIRLLRPIIKRLAKNEDQYWSEFIPPWVKREL